MHHLDLGLFQYQIDYTTKLLDKSLNDKMNDRIALIPRHPGLKIFAKGLQHRSKSYKNYAYRVPDIWGKFAEVRAPIRYLI